MIDWQVFFPIFLFSGGRTSSTAGARRPLGEDPGGAAGAPVQPGRADNRGQEAALARRGIDDAPDEDHAAHPGPAAIHLLIHRWVFFLF